MFSLEKTFAASASSFHPLHIRFIIFLRKKKIRNLSRKVKEFYPEKMFRSKCSVAVVGGGVVVVVVVGSGGVAVAAVVVVAVVVD